MSKHLKHRTINNMKPLAQAKANRLWDIIKGPGYDTDHWRDCRDQYYAMFEDDSNFLPGTAPYRSPEWETAA